MTNEEFGKALEEVAASERWRQIPGICSVLRPLPSNWCVERKEACFTFHPAEWMMNPAGWLHGGIIATMFDNAMGAVAMVCANGCFTPTVSMTLDYMRPTPVSGALCVRVSVLKAGHNLIHIRAELYAAEDSEKLYASTAAVYAIHHELKV